MPVEERFARATPAKVSGFQICDAENAFEVLVKEYHRQVLSYAQSLVNEPSVAEDLAQEAFVVAWQKFDTFDSNLDFGKWVRGILHLKYRKLMREKKIQPISPEILEEIETQHDLWHESGKSLLDILMHCMSQLTRPLRQAIDLHYLRNQSCRDIASATGAQESTIRKRLQFGREALADCMKRKADVRLADETGKAH